MEGYALRPWRLGEEESRKKIISLACCFSLSQSRKGRKGCAGYVGLCDHCGLARKKYPAINEALAGAEGAKAPRGMQGLAIFAAWRERFPQVVINLSQRREER